MTGKTSAILIGSALLPDMHVEIRRPDDGVEQRLGSPGSESWVEPLPARHHIARTMARKDVLPKGTGSAIRMIEYFINRAGHNLAPISDDVRSLRLLIRRGILDRRRFRFIRRGRRRRRLVLRVTRWAIWVCIHRYKAVG